MPSREDDTLARLTAELAKERAAHRATLDRLAEAEARARAWRRVARWLHEARCEDTKPPRSRRRPESLGREPCPPTPPP